MPDVWEAMTDTAHDRYRKIRRTMAGLWRAMRKVLRRQADGWAYVKRCHESDDVQMEAIRRRVGVLEREMNGHVVIGKPDRR